ncbi:MAG: methyltransferase domain-containing protein [Sphingobacteriales bacterium]
MKAYPFSHFPPDFGDRHDGSIVKLKKDRLNASLFSKDTAFDWMYPEYFQLLSNHWTPLAIARKAAGFLAEPGARILDIGSGTGKFCLAAGYHFPETFFHGVEQRHELFCMAEEAKEYTKLLNVNFIYANITQINFKEFDHFYFYNSFYENINRANKIDDTIELSESLYSFYTQYLYTALDERPSGTRLVTFHSLEQEVPPGFKLADVSCDGQLKMWIKE